MTLRARFRFWTAFALLAAAIVFRAFPFVWWPGAHFDSDQATVGLMARHISEGEAFPLYYYGQPSMLAVEAYLAAPFIRVLGTTVTALKLPLVLINVAVVLVLMRLLVRDARLGPWAASIAALPLALPAAAVAARTTGATGGNVEPWLYILLLWAVRARPVAFGILLGIGMLHRELTAYGAVALLAMDAATVLTTTDRRAAVADRARHWTLAAVAWSAVQALARSLQPFASAWGPGTHGDDVWAVMPAVDTLGGGWCFGPETWADRTHLLLTDHLPRIVGGIGAPLRDYGVLSGVYSGHPAVGTWAGVLTAAGLAGGGWHWWVRRRSPGAESMPHIGGYLLLVGVISTLVYGFATCGAIRIETLRDNLLGVFIPVGALVMGLQMWPQPLVRAGFGVAVALWCSLNMLDVLALLREYRTDPPVDSRQVLADDLVARGVTSAKAPLRTAYHVTFLAAERVRIAATDFSRIRTYAEEADRTLAPSISDLPCERGTALTGGHYLCPRAEAGEGRRRGTVMK
jgi:hypothetical protein